MEYSYRDELYHHGILGQKWGVRRYQNEDGTLTETGKRHKKSKEKTLTRQEKRQIRKTREEVFKNEYKNGSRLILDYKDQEKKARDKILDEYGDEAVRYLKNWERNMIIMSGAAIAINILKDYHAMKLDLQKYNW